MRASWPEGDEHVRGDHARLARRGAPAACDDVVKLHVDWLRFRRYAAHGTEQANVPIFRKLLQQSMQLAVEVRVQKDVVLENDDGLRALCSDLLPDVQVAHEAPDHAGRAEVPGGSRASLLEFLVCQGLAQSGGKALRLHALLGKLLLAILPPLNRLVQVHDPHGRRLDGGGALDICGPRRRHPNHGHPSRPLSLPMPAQPRDSDRHRRPGECQVLKMHRVPASPAMARKCRLLLVWRQLRKLRHLFRNLRDPSQRRANLS
mmetsp:Transcript_178607/g.572530  ORF Transcript_178607/g.572530 Transcript_178607/m.572530 type:complete len:261 (-) Transcript_178607:267-1049(-)